MSILVTGATGTIGREVVRALASRGETPIALVRDPDRARALFSGVSVGFRRFDYDDPTSFDAFEGGTALFSVTPLDPEPVEASRRALEAARARGLTHVVRLSSRATGWDRVSILRAWHRAIEADIERLFPSFTHLRPCSFLQNLVNQQGTEIRTQDRIVLPLGEGRISYVDAFDVGEVGAICLLDPRAHAGRTYGLTGPRALTGEELALAIGDARGRPVRYVAADPRVVRERSIAAGVPDWLVDSGLRIFEHAIAGGEAEIEPFVEAITGRSPRSVEAFARANVEAFRAS